MQSAPAAARWSWRLLALALGAAAAGWPLLGWAGGASEPASAAVAHGWLQRIHSAASQRNYQGTLVVSASGSLSSSRLAHYCEADQFFERIDMQDGQARSVYRQNDQVLTVWPAAKVALIEQRDAVALFPAVLSGSEDQLLERYEMVPEGMDRVAGHDARVFLLRPRDTDRFAQRLWAEQGSGLLLRADVLAADGHVLESAAFTDVTIGVKAHAATVRAAMKRLEGYRVLRSAPQRTALDAEGWRLTPPVAGFKQISCVRQSLASDAEGERGTPASVLQTIFTDGLTHVSVFVEPYRAERHHPGSGAVGATHTLMQALGPYWVTVMGDVPMTTLKQFAAALERAH